MSNPAIRIQCDRCEKRLRVPASAAGKTVRCPNCKAALQVRGAEEEVGPIGLAGDEERPRDVLLDLQPPEERELERRRARGEVPPRRGKPSGPPRADRTRRRPRGPGLGAAVRLLLSIPFFALAVVSALITAWNGACFILLRVIQIVHYSPEAVEAQWSAVGFWFLGLLVTMGLFWIAECVKHGRVVSMKEAFNLKKDS